MDPALRRTLEQWFDRQFGHIPIEWAPPEWYVTARFDDHLVGRLSVVRRTVRAGDQLIEVGGVAGVTTLPELRGRGIARALMERTAALIADDLGRAFGLLLCQAEVAPVYARAGWTKVAGPTSFQQSKGARLTRLARRAHRSLRLALVVSARGARTSSPRDSSRRPARS